MNNPETHKFLLDNESMSEVENKIDVNDLLTDIKVLMREYYVATFGESGKSLNIAFNNGQKFRLTVEEVRA